MPDSFSSPTRLRKNKTGPKAGRESGKEPVCNLYASYLMATFGSWIGKEVD
jgi:hypothetical protein